MPGMSWAVRESWLGCGSSAHTAPLLPMLQKPKTISLQKAKLEELGWQKGRILHPHPAMGHRSTEEQWHRRRSHRARIRPMPSAPHSPTSSGQLCVTTHTCTNTGVRARTRMCMKEGTCTHPPLHMRTHTQVYT